MKGVPHDVRVVTLLRKAVANLLDLQVGDPVRIRTQSVHQINLELKLVKGPNRAVDNCLKPVLDISNFLVNCLH